MDYKLSLDNPCTKVAWDEMTPREGGKFCGSCKKLVVDFSAMTDQQIIKWFQDRSMIGKELCFNAAPDQLNRAITPLQRIVRVPKYVWGLVVTAFLSVGAKAQCEDTTATTTWDSVDMAYPKWDSVRHDTTMPGEPVGKPYNTDGNFDVVHTNLRTGVTHRVEWRMRGTGSFTATWYELPVNYKWIHIKNWFRRLFGCK